MNIENKTSCKIIPIINIRKINLSKYLQNDFCLPSFTEITNNTTIRNLYGEKYFFLLRVVKKFFLSELYTIIIENLENPNESFLKIQLLTNPNKYLKIMIRNPVIHSYLTSYNYINYGTFKTLFNLAIITMNSIDTSLVPFFEKFISVPDIKDIQNKLKYFFSDFLIFNNDSENIHSIILNIKDSNNNIYISLDNENKFVQKMDSSGKYIKYNFNTYNDLIDGIKKSLDDNTKIVISSSQNNRSEKAMAITESVQNNRSEKDIVNTSYENQKVQLFLLGLLRAYKRNNITNLNKFTSNYIDQISQLLIKYNITLISAIYFLLDIPREMIMHENILKWYNKFITQSSSSYKYKYFMEDFWNCSLEQFIVEYNQFEQTKQSFLFFRKNLINFAILLCKFKTKDFEKFRPNIKTYDYIPLITLLVKALSCNYDDVFNFYNEFIEFILEFKHNHQYNNYVLNYLRDISRNNLFVYFSLNNVKDYIYARTQYTKFCTTITNPEVWVHKEISNIRGKNMSFTIIHDFNIHLVYTRKKKFTRQNQIDFLKYAKLIYDKYGNYNLLNILHEFYHEKGNNNFTFSYLINKIINRKKTFGVIRNAEFNECMKIIINLFIEKGILTFHNNSNKNSLISSIRNNTKFNNISYIINEEVIEKLDLLIIPSNIKLYNKLNNSTFYNNNSIMDPKQNNEKTEKRSFRNVLLGKKSYKE